MLHQGYCMLSRFSHHIRIWSLFLRMRMMGTHNKPKCHQLLAHSNFVDVYVLSYHLLVSHAGGKIFSLISYLDPPVYMLNSSQGLLDILWLYQIDSPFSWFLSIHAYFQSRNAAIECF